MEKGVLPSTKNQVMNALVNLVNYFRFFSQSVGRKGSRIRGLKGSSVCLLMILSGI